MNNTDAHLRAFQLKGSLMTLTILELLNTDLSAIHAQLTDLIKKTPDFFQGMPIVVDLNKLKESLSSEEVTAIFACLREKGLVPVGVRSGSVAQKQLLLAAHLPVLNPTKIEKTDTPETVSEPESNVSPSESFKKSPLAQVITHPVRSGQQVYAKGRDLIVLTSVSPGAEVIADGHIHIYGALHGRALAGATGDLAARIFCQKMEAQLVSIAGHYWLNEDLARLSVGGAVQVYLEDEHLRISTF